MKYIERQLRKSLLQQWDSGKVMIVLGPRQAGKTTLIESICKEKGSFLFLNGDDPEIRAILENAGEKKLSRIIGKHETVFIDEAQRIKDIGLISKIIHDRLKGKRLVISGSSSLELSDEMNEPLTGRKWEHLLYPICWMELVNYAGYVNARSQLHTRLVYGMYPEVIMQDDNAQDVLKSLTGSYLYKDLLRHEGVRKPELLEKLLIALALQIGSEVNFNELANTLRVDRATVERYIDLLEKTFVIFKLRPLSRKLRNELSSGRKIYFYDNGIRNALIGDFKFPELRNDIGQLWENFIISERQKRNNYRNWHGRSWFWRTYQQQEIDLIEEIDGDFSAYETKWKQFRQVKFPRTFTDNYKPVISLAITPENFDDFLE
jgi:uncharacterized protein